MRNLFGVGSFVNSKTMEIYRGSEVHCPVKRLIWRFLVNLVKRLRANPTKCSNPLKKFVGKWPTNCLSMFDHFVGLALKGLTADKLFECV